ncbi:DUF6311 domain-containing protein [Paenibacillus sp. NPDC101420]|uniref:DUF6311 domain-containing protein n=1 Tax=Paenibacillus sp. NPDC101420 TaxID=3390602 RepID=UPI003D08B460
MKHELSNKKNLLIALLVLMVIFIFSWRFGTIYTALGLSLLMSMLFLVFNEKTKSLRKGTISSIGIILGGGLGAVFFITVLNPNTLDTSSINWLLTRVDPAQHFVGWHFFRSEEWSFPPGIIKNLNTPIGTSITYTDSVPLLAFILKIFNPILPPVFQYMGIWMLLCYVLQGVFGLLLMRKLTQNLSLQLLGVMFFVMSPIMLFRSFSHEALMGHWIILAGLYLFKSTYIHRKWLFLFFVSLLVHPYLFIMIFAIFVLKMIELLVSNEINIRECILYSISTIMLILFTLWFIGYFYIGSSGSTGDFGYYSMNINSIFNPLGWSEYFLKDQPLTSHGQGEGFNYLGLGVILLLFWSFYTLVNNRKFSIRRNIGLLLLSIIFTLIALSNVITYSDKVILEINLPAFVMSLLGIVRASGRFFWPVYYLLILFSLSTIIKNNKRKQAIIFLVVALSIQFADLSGKFNEYNNMYTNDTILENPLKSEVWAKLDEKKYKNIVFVPAKVNDQNIAFAMLAANKGMTINSFYTARDDNEKKDNYDNELMGVFERGEWNSKSIYIVDNSLLEKAMKNKKINDLLLLVDGFNVLIPNGVVDQQIVSLNLDLYSYRYNYGDIVNFGVSGNSSIIKSVGWSSTEEISTWTEGDHADLNFSLQKPENDLILTMKMSPLLGGETKVQNLIVTANNQEIKRVSINSYGTYQFVIPKEIVSDQLKISLILPDATSPYMLGISEDQRKLALSVENIILDEISH